MRPLILAALLLATMPAMAQPMTRAELLVLADSSYALTMAERCGRWGDARWHAEAMRRVRLVAAMTTPSRRDRAYADGAMDMAARRARDTHALLGPIACRAVDISGARDAYQRAMDDPRLATHTIPPTTED